MLSNLRSLSEFVSCNIKKFYPYRGIAYFKCVEINKASLSKLSFQYLFAGPSVLVFDNQNMVAILQPV